MARPRIPAPASTQLAWLITIPLVLVATGTSLPVVLQNGDFGRNIEFLPVFLAMFVASGLTMLRFDIRRQAVLVSLNELPLLLALFYLPPTLVLAARVFAATAVQLVNRTALVKGAFNVASVAAGTACANLVAFEVGARNPNQPVVWLVLSGAVFANTVVISAATGGVITLVQGASHTRQLWRSSGFNFVVTVINVLVGLIVLLTLQANTWSVFLLAGLGVVFGVAYRAYVRFVRQHKSLTEMYDLTRALSATGNDRTLIDVLLARVRAAVQAESATLWLPGQGRHPEVLLSARADYDGLFDSAPTPESLRQSAIEAGHTVLVGPKCGSGELRRALTAQGVKDAIVVPLRSGTVAIGTLEVAGRLGDRTSFEPDDARFVETVAAHAGVAIENSRLVDRLRFDAMHDSLTALPNRRRMLDALSEAIAAPALNDVIAVALFDVVGLRQVNESLGYAAGDRVLIEIADRLRNLSPPGAMVARIGGDEFAVEIRVDNADAALTMAEAVRDGLREPIALGSLAIDIDATVGVAVHPDHGDAPDVLLQRAELTAYVAKSHGSIQLFNAGLESRSVRRLGLAGDLRRALDCDELEVYFQPKLSISDRRLLGVECLARWEHPVHGSVAPGDVVAVAEHTGQLGRLTEVVLREGLRRAREWAEAGRPLSVSVNIAARTLLDAGFPDQVAALIEEYGVPAERLVLEITEEVMAADTERPLPTIHRLHEVGVGLSVDDFGTGYSSLAYLRRLPIQEIKVDRSFVQGMATDARDFAVVRSVVDMARHLGLTSVAEGVESEPTLGMLREIGCDIGQGFLFSRPLPYDRLDMWLRGQQPENPPQTFEEGRRLRAVP